eukprot:CAMPEP_0202503460 /NCGR_PEP_ID=MMETSP1361-20130828/41735_1 /ASSEMBLY_ACC=CAM_ASM_000849 /TAXON_ID=210615 /ORGANISM="Staurosira complex sp., Strain CCMP2646" /LENGTH=50 /DNA_ID=CAMNT_0049136677 /DNA_START=67 /DNA_END=219 /DNA_ORIENTATION=+
MIAAEKTKTIADDSPPVQALANDVALQLHQDGFLKLQLPPQIVHVLRGEE